MKYKDAVILENRTNIEELPLIYLYKEGKWWKAYEWSAYLCHNLKTYNDKYHSLKLVHKITKDCPNGFIYCGLKDMSLDKYFGNFKTIKYTDNEIVVSLGDDFPKNINVDGSILLLNELKEKLNSKTKNKDYDKLIPIITEIYMYPIENKTLLDNLNFLIYLKKKINDLYF